MMHYLVKHESGDFRLHTSDGSEPLSTGWQSQPSVNDIVAQCAEDGPGGSLLGQNDIRGVFVDAISGGISYRDLTQDNETVPWQ